MANETLLHLQHSESVVAQLSATICAALIRNAGGMAFDEDALIEKSTAIAIKLAVRAEKLVKSDQEWVRKD